MDSLETVIVDPVTGSALPPQRSTSTEDPAPISVDDVEARRSILAATVVLLNRDDRLVPSTAEICGEASIDDALFLRTFPTPQAVCLTVAETVIADLERQAGATIMRRRSLTESVRLALVASWELVESRFDEHHATMTLIVEGTVRQPLGGGEARTLHASFVASIERTLGSLEEVHGITWELPVRQLARLTMATMSGLILDYQHSRDSRGIRDMLELFAYHLAQHGRRVAKNYPH